ncbi:hypothetical protein CANARDRAFT_8751 [[Candida] arabinofermentans NRRL YB-2248]|uniref:Uncharacterized protein n=1 Tax=[Candida] arabinofermentans NRRL YB-2248 TaxID=983967 RepID=A0A1E4SY25_9ASCO|nr:hypothetical protein CANARDRAFT_8751 [[Candida] arabinofermentans NRRL YB-2248]
MINILAREDVCESGNDYNNQQWGVRISAIFVVMFASAFGSLFPIIATRFPAMRIPPLCFFIAKYFGSGVIVATAFIHLLEPASDALGNECLGGVFAEYPMAFGICLISLMVMFFGELIAYRWFEDKVVPQNEAHTHSHFGDTDVYLGGSTKDEDTKLAKIDDLQLPKSEISLSDEETLEGKERYLGSLFNVLVLDFGVIFHSVFVGLTLAVSGDEFKTLYIVVTFHQLFEGLGLGSRVAMIEWPRLSWHKWIPWILSAAYSLTTPIAIGIGLGVRNSFPPNSRTALITNGVFDSISAGILIYTGIVELMAREFLFGDEFKGEYKFRNMMAAYGTMSTGAGLMALLGKWA